MSRFPDPLSCPLRELILPKQPTLVQGSGSQEPSSTQGPATILLCDLACHHTLSGLQFLT